MENLSGQAGGFRRQDGRAARLRWSGWNGTSGRHAPSRREGQIRRSRSRTASDGRQIADEGETAARNFIRRTFRARPSKTGKTVQENPIRQSVRRMAQDGIGARRQSVPRTVPAGFRVGTTHYKYPPLRTRFSPDTQGIFTFTAVARRDNRSTARKSHP